MKLNELQQGDRIMIEACMEHRSIECPTTIAQLLPNGVILNAVRVDGKVLNFDVEGVIINLIYTTGETAPDMWRGVTLSMTEIKGRKFYECLLERESVRVNRRGAYRVSVSDPGIIHLSSGKQGFRIGMRDISETGFSFYLDEDAKVEINQKDHLELTFDTGEYRFNLDGYVGTLFCFI